MAAVAGRVGHETSPAGERGITPGYGATGDGRCGGARTGRAWRCDHRCERRTGGRTKPSIRPWGSGRRRGGLASLPSDRGGIPPVFGRWRRSCPLPLPVGGWGARRPSIFKENASDESAEHRPSTRRQKRSANRLRTRCGQIYNRYGWLCQASSCLSPLTLSSPRARHGVRLFFGRTAVAKPARPRVKHGATASLGWEADTTTSFPPARMSRARPTFAGSLRHGSHRYHVQPLASDAVPDTCVGDAAPARRGMVLDQPNHE